MRRSILCGHGAWGYGAILASALFFASCITARVDYVIPVSIMATAYDDVSGEPLNGVEALLRLEAKRTGEMEVSLGRASDETINREHVFEWGRAVGPLEWHLGIGRCENRLTLCFRKPGYEPTIASFYLDDLPRQDKKCVVSLGKVFLKKSAK